MRSSESLLLVGDIKGISPQKLCTSSLYSTWNVEAIDNLCCNWEICNAKLCDLSL